MVQGMIQKVRAQIVDEAHKFFIATLTIIVWPICVLIFISALAVAGMALWCCNGLDEIIHGQRRRY